MFVDSHCHLDYLQRDGADVGEILTRAKRAGVAYALTIGTRLSTFANVLAIAESYDNIACSVGVHPHESGAEGVADRDILLDYVSHPKIVALGETGLDYYYEHSARQAQQASFRSHIDAARESGLPLVVHTRSADEDTIAILQEEYRKGAFKGVIHCFSTSRWLAERALELGFYISLSGILTFNKSDELRAIARDLPLERLLIETDSPYLAPMPHRGKTNEPAYVAQVATKLAQLKERSPEDIAAITADNFFTLFDKFPRSPPLSLRQ